MEWKEQSKKQHIRIADMVLVGVCLFGAGILTLFFLLQRKDAQTVCISYDGETLYEQTLPQGDAKWYYLITWQNGEIRQEFDTEAMEIPKEGSYNLIVITQEGVSMEGADCRDQICVHHVPITTDGESIICLPHRLVVQMKQSSAEQETLDGMVK